MAVAQQPDFDPFDPSLQTNNTGIDKGIGFVKGAERLVSVPGAVASMAVANTRANMQMLNPFDGWQGPVESSLNAAGEGMKNGVKGFSDMGGISTIGKVVAGAVVVGRTVQAVNEFKRGNTAGGLAKIARGLGEAALSAVSISGIAIIPDLISKVFTGEFLTTHAGNLIENTSYSVFKGAEGFMGSAKGKVAAMAAVPAAAAVAAGNMVGGQKLHFGSPPPREQAASIDNTTQQMGAYGKSNTHFRDMVSAQRGGPQMAASMAPTQGFAADEVARRAQAQFAAQQGATV